MTVDLERAKAGDEHVFATLVEPFRRELQLHCYRLLGSVQDAEDLVQETLLAAWRGLDGFEERASLRSWLYRIATNRSLNAIRERALVACLGPREIDGHRVNDTSYVGNGPAVRSAASRCLT